MSCITVSKKWSGSTATSVETMTPVIPVATSLRRSTKRARASPQLVDTVREVVQAFELEFAQVRAESVELKAVLDDRRTQLVDLRRHLEKESGNNGTLEAVVQHRNSKNECSDARLAELEREFSEVIEDDRVVAIQTDGLKSDVGVFTKEHRRIRENISVIMSQLTLAETTLGERERAFAKGQRESERLSSELQEIRRKFDEQENRRRDAEERASKMRSLASDAAAKLEALEEKVVRFRGDVDAKESDKLVAASNAATMERQSEEIHGMIREDRAAHMRGLGEAQDCLVKIKGMVEEKESCNAEMENCIQALQLSVAAESEAQDTKRSEIAALRTSQKETVDIKVRDISAQVGAVEAEVAQAEEAVERASKRMKEANKEFSSLMAAMSAAFREYDQAVTSNRELESEVEKAEAALATLSEHNQQELIAMREVRDKLFSSNAENRVAATADRQLVVVLTESIRETEKAVDEMTLEVETRREIIETHRIRLEEGRAKKRAHDEERAEEIRTAKEALGAAQKRSFDARGQLDQRQAHLSYFLRLMDQSELAKFRRQAAEWTCCAPSKLNESDLTRVEKEARVALETLRVNEDKDHVSRTESLRSTLSTIREGGAARLKAEEDAAVARVATLQNQRLEALRSVAELRSRLQATQQTEKNIQQEIRNRQENARRAAEAQAVAAVAAQATAFRAQDTHVDLSSNTTPKICATSHTSTEMRKLDAHVEHLSIQNPEHTCNIVGGNSTSTISTPNVPPNQHASSSVSRSTRVFPCIEDSVRGMGSYPVHTSGSGQERHSNDHQVTPTIIESAPSRRHSDRRPHHPPGRSSKSSRSRSRDPATRSQQASESTAEAAGSQEMSASGGKYGNKKGGNGGMVSRYKRQERSLAQKSTKSINHSEGEHKRSSRRGDGVSRGRQRYDSSRKGSSRSKTGSPRSLSTSPRPADKEYDLWTDNRLVGDSDFSFF